jgi:hypothetical protein
VSCLVVSLGSWILRRLREGRRCDARRRFASVLSCVFTKLVYAICGIFGRRHDARCRFASIVSYSVSMLLLTWFGIEVGVATVGVATLSVDSTKCRRVSRGSSTINIWDIVGVATVGVATLGVGLSASCLVALLGSSAQKMASCVGVAMPIVGVLVVGSCHVICHPERHVSLIMEKIIPKPKIFTETRTQASFRVWHLSSCNLLSEINKFCLGAVLLLCLVLELHKTYSSGLEPGTDLCYGVCFYNLLFETNNFGLGAVLLLCLVSELQKTSSLRIESKTIFRGSGLYFCNLLFETNNFGPSAILLSCLVSELTGNALRGNQTQDTFSEFWPSYDLFLVSRNKHAKFGANRYIRSRATSINPQFQLYM